ncbi:MAG: hypothetical protein Ta2E_01150 [Mycoplasmoidaceae bacterium]|nr:MAG: hypothetical protein Ta2E_01150 [Mycoplasmoidaceae bacterium]
MGVEHTTPHLKVLEPSEQLEVEVYKNELSADFEQKILEQLQHEAELLQKFNHLNATRESKAKENHLLEQIIEMENEENGIQDQLHNHRMEYERKTN